MFGSDGSINPPRGVRGGHDGACAEQRKRHVDGTTSELRNYDRVVLQPGETVISICSAGGGYGPPHERDPDRVLADVREGFLTRDRARDVYRVVVTAANELDIAATAALRSGDEPRR